MNELEHRTAEAAPRPGTESDADGLLERLEQIEAEPLAHRAALLEQLHDELLVELQRSDRSGE